MTNGTDYLPLLREAVRLERAQRLPEAAAAYERLLARFPDLPDSWYNLALIQRRLRRYDDALVCYQNALDRGVSRPEEVHLNRGVIYSDCLRRDDAAGRELSAALALNPRYVPALLNLANLKSDLGLRDEALAFCERVLAIDPDSSEGLARYAGLRCVAGADDPLIGQLQRALADPATSAADQATLGFALGKLLDECGAYEHAFAAYAAANQASRASAGPGALPYDRARHERFVDQLIAAFPPGGAVSSATPAPAPRPIFICGMFRSGSTLAEQVLAGHSRVQAGGELDLLPALVQDELAPFPSRMADVDPQQLGAYAARYVNTLARMFPGATHVTDKRPDNFLHIGLIKALFPDARIVHTTRNALDNCLSVHFLHLDHGMGYALDLLDTAHYYRHYQRLMAHWREQFGADILDFDYDAFVREPRPAVERLLAFCGLDWEEECMAFHRVRNAVKTASVWQVREPLYQRSSGRWRNYARHLDALRAYLAEPGGVASTIAER